MNFFSFLVRRIRRHWQILLTLSLGVFLSTSLLASSPILVNTVVEFGLRRTLIAADPLSGNLRLKTFGRVDAATYSELDSRIQAHLQPRLLNHMKQVIPTAGTRWLFPWVDEQPVTDQRVNIRFYGRDDTDISNYVNLVAGRWPSIADASSDRLSAVISEEFAQAYGLAVGDLLPLSVTRQESAPNFWLAISGIIQPINPRDSYWFGSLTPLHAQSDDRWSAQYTAIVPYDDFFPSIQNLFPDIPMELSWMVDLSPESFAAKGISTFRSQLDALADDLRAQSPSVTIESQLDQVLANFNAQAEAIRAPLYFLTAEVVLLVLYYVIMVAALAVRQVEREFAILQSRGASGGQIFQIQAGEAFIISLTALVSGPALGMLLVKGLILAGPLADVSEPGWVLTLPQAAWLAAGMGALASIMGLLIPVGPAVKRTIVTYQQSATRDSRTPLWQRYYLDVFVLAIGLVLLWRLQVYGSIVGGSISRPRVDWLLVLSPVALLLGAGTILLRVFPLALQGLAAIASRGRGLPAVLAMRQAARSPNHVARLVLLLTLAMSLGILTTGINATLDESELERSRYTTGSDLRISSRRSIPLSKVDKLDNVSATTGVWRGAGSVSIGRDYNRFDILAIDPFSFANITQYRGDFSERPMGELLGELVMEEIQEQPSVPLPGKPGKFGFWLWSAPDPEEGIFYLGGESDFDRIGLEIKIRTAKGELISHKLTSGESGYPEDGWRFFETELPQLSDASYPIGVHSIWIRSRARTVGDFSRYIATDMRLAVDDLTVTDIETGETTIAEDMENLLTLWQLDDLNSSVNFDLSNAHSGETSQLLNLHFREPHQQIGFKLVSLFTRYDPIPCLVSPQLLAAVEAQVGDVIQIVVNSQSTVFRIAGTVRYFPTMYENANAGYIITNRDALLANMNSISNKSINVNESLLQVSAGTTADAVTTAAMASIPEIDQAWESENVRKTIKADPMALGLRSVTFFGYVLTTLLSLIGFATYFYMNARQKESVYGVLRSIGLSPRQLYGTLVMEQVVLILAGLAIGTGLGMLLNQITLPGLPITFGDRPPTPPFIARSNWLAVGRIYLTLAIAFFVTLGLATMLLWRTKLHRVLRVGEE